MWYSDGKWYRNPHLRKMSWNNLRILAWMQYIKFNMRIKYDKYYLDEMWNCIQVKWQVMWLFLKLKLNVWNKCYKNFDEYTNMKYNDEWQNFIE